MLHHVVMWKLKDFAEGRTRDENIEFLICEYEKLKEHIPQVKSAQMYKSVGGEGFNDLILFSRFKDETELNEYINHPLHKEYSKMFAALRESRSAVDYYD